MEGDYAFFGSVITMGRKGRTCGSQGDTSGASGPPSGRRKDE